MSAFGWPTGLGPTSLSADMDLSAIGWPTGLKYLVWPSSSVACAVSRSLAHSLSLSLSHRCVVAAAATARTFLLCMPLS